MRQKDLTPLQKKALIYIRDFRMKFNLYPTLRQIANAVGTRGGNPQSAKHLVEALVRHGFMLERDNRLKARQKYVLVEKDGWMGLVAFALVYADSFRSIKNVDEFIGLYKVFIAYSNEDKAGLLRAIEDKDIRERFKEAVINLQ